MAEGLVDVKDFSREPRSLSLAGKPALALLRPSLSPQRERRQPAAM